MWPRAGSCGAMLNWIGHPTSRGIMWRRSFQDDSAIEMGEHLERNEVVLRGGGVEVTKLNAGEPREVVHDLPTWWFVPENRVR